MNYNGKCAKNGEENKFNQNSYNLMETTPTHKMWLLLPKIQLSVYKIISQFSTLYPIPVLKILHSRSAQTWLIKALLFYFETKKLWE